MHRLATLVMAGALLGGCAGGGTPAASTPAGVAAADAPDVVDPGEPAGAHEGGDVADGGAGATAASRSAQPKRGEQAPKSEDVAGIVVVPQQASHRAAGPARVKPASLDIGALPLAMLPEPFQSKDAPESLPHGIRNADEITVRDSHRNADPNQERSVYVVVDKELSRLQIGHITARNHTGRQVYRRCGQERARVAPARWMMLTRMADQVVLRLTDAWFDHKSCQMAIMRDTYVKPSPVLGGLWWAFRTRCDSCAQKDWLVVLTPHLQRVSHSGMGVQPHVTNGTLSIVRLPMRRGGAAMVSAQIQPHAAKQWTKALALKKLPPIESSQVIQMGLELMQTVSDPMPSAIVYATVQQPNPFGGFRRSGFGLR